MQINTKTLKSILNKLVEENNVGFPDFMRKNSDDVDATVLTGIPLELVVVPQLKPIF